MVYNCEMGEYMLIKGIPLRETASKIKKTNKTVEVFSDDAKFTAVFSKFNISN